MGAGKSRKTGSGNKRHKINKSRAREVFTHRHIDLVFEDYVKDRTAVHDGRHGPVGSVARADLDDDLPGQGQHFCCACSRYFVDAETLARHERTKQHKKRVKELQAMKDQGLAPHSQRDAERFGGMGAPDSGRGPPRAAPMVH